MWIGGVTGGVAGLGAGLYARDECENRPQNDRDCLAPVILAPVLIGGTGVLIGAGIGALVGAVMDETEVAYVPAHGGGTLTTRVRF
jgi:hypothetical protein